MLREVQTDNRALTKEELQRFAEKANLDIPEPYLRFLQQYNGGRPVPDIFPIEGLPLNPDGAIQVFFGLGDTVPAVDLENVLNDLSASVPRGIFPIACTDGGDYICLDLRKPEKPVVYWDRREFWGNEVWKERYLYPIAPNFEAFLVSLRDE